MSFQQSLQQNVLDNPIMRHEATTLSRQRGKRFWWFMYGLSLVLFLIPIFWGFDPYFATAVNFTAYSLIFANGLIYLLVVLKAISTANDSTYRQQRGKTWELLMLTGVSNWRMVFGKWLGVMRFLVRDFLWLYLLRIGAIFWAFVLQNISINFEYRCLYPNYWDYIPNCDPNLLNINLAYDALFYAALFILVFTVLELMMSSAIGMATAFFKWTARTGGTIAMGIRLALGIALPLLVLFLFSFEDGQPFQRSYYTYYGYQAYEYELSTLLFRSSTIFADNGIMTMPAFFDADYLFNKGVFGFWAGNLVGAALYILITVAALLIAGNRAFVRGVNRIGADELIFAGKSKRKHEPTKANSAAVAISNNPQIINIPHGIKQALSLEKAETATIELYHYQRRLGRLILRITGAGEPFYWQFTNVAYVETPSFWKGPTLETASENDYRAFVQEKQLPISSLAEETMRLYRAEGVRIVAGQAEILQELPTNI